MISHLVTKPDELTTQLSTTLLFNSFSPIWYFICFLLNTGLNNTNQQFTRYNLILPLNHPITLVVCPNINGNMSETCENKARFCIQTSCWGNLTFHKKGTWICSSQHTNILSLNSSPPSATYMRLWNGSSLVQIMDCRLDGTKPLSEPMLTYCQLEPREHISMKLYLKFKYFHSRKCIWTCRLRDGGHFVEGELS